MRNANLMHLRQRHRGPRRAVLSVQWVVCTLEDTSGKRTGLTRTWWWALKSFKERVGRNSQSRYRALAHKEHTHWLKSFPLSLDAREEGVILSLYTQGKLGCFENFWISNFSFAMIEYYEKATIRQMSLFWTYGSRCLGFIMAGDRNDSWTTAENSYLQLVTGSKENALEVAHGFWNLKAYPQWQTLSNQVTFPKFTQTGPPSGEQDSNVQEYGGHLIQTSTRSTTALQRRRLQIDDGYLSVTVLWRDIMTVETLTKENM